MPDKSVTVVLDSVDQIYLAALALAQKSDEGTAVIRAIRVAYKLMEWEDDEGGEILLKKGRTIHKMTFEDRL